MGNVDDGTVTTKGCTEMLKNGMPAVEIENANWQKARASINDGNCVEVAATPEGVAMRNSRFPGDPALLFTEAEMTAFLDGAKAGEFDHLVG